MLDKMLDRVDKVFSRWAKYDSPGAALAIVSGGEVVYKQGYGMANLEYDVPISPNTIFHVASVSKQFTAMAVALLVEDGLLSLDDNIRDHLPEVPDFGPAITLRHLAHHTSGLRDQWELLILGGWRMDDVITRDHIMKLVRRQKELNFEPGEEYLYCNTGYTLLAEVVKRVSGSKLGEFAEDRIFAPLRMSNTHFHDDHERIVKNRAYSYAPHHGYFKKQVLSYANVGATSLFTTVEDLAKWALNFKHRSVGQKAALELLQEPYVLNNSEKIDYRLGLSVGEYRGLCTVGHDGADAGFRSSLIMFPSEEFAVIVLCNLGTMVPGRLARQVADICLEQSLEPASGESETTPASTVTGAEITGIYTLQGMLVLLVEEDDGRLVLTAPGIDAAPLAAQDDGSYRLEQTGMDLRFTRHASGQVELTTTAWGPELRATMVEPPSIDCSELEEYLGGYYCPELDTTYHLSLAGEQLVVQHRKRPDFRLYALGDDRFASTSSRLGGLHFDRAAGGEVKGFRLTTSRVRNLAFERL